MNAIPRSATTVVVTGLGATTPLGGDTASTWAGLLAGRPGVVGLTEEWAAELPVRIAAPAAEEPTEKLSRVEARKMDRSAQLALVAAREAWADAGFSGPAGGEGSPLDPDRVGVAVGTGIGGLTTLLAQYDNLNSKGPRRVSPHTVPMMMPNSPAANVELEVHARAGAHTTVSACATGTEAIGYGMEMIRAGRADVVVAGGTEAVIHPLPIAAFAAMMAMSKRNDDPEHASRPFDKGRDGFVLGEGAGIVILESAEHAARRGARVYAELAGQGLSSDAHHIAQPDPSGSGVELALQRALDDSGLAPEQITHINAHATSTPQGDAAEAGALARVLGPHVANVPLTATKSMTGHMLGAAGAVEAIAAIMAVYDRVAPPTINVEDPDDDLPVDLVVGEPRKLGDGPQAVLSNSFGFGGANAVIAFTSPRQGSTSPRQGSTSPRQGGTSPRQGSRTAG